MKPLPQYCLITPSYAPDFERCRLLCWSIEKFCNPSIHHYIVVDQKDVKLFQQLQNKKTEILTVESMLPWWIKKVKVFQNGWLSLKTLPIRNWLLQQIIKIGMAQYVSEDILIFVDSDVTFVRPFNCQTFSQNGLVRLYREPSSIDERLPGHLKWYQTASRLLGLPPVAFPLPNYIGNLITWKRENVFQLYQHIEKISGRGWIETLANSWHLSEYVLYGVFVDKILKDQSGHYYDEQNPCHDYFLSEALSPEHIKQFVTEIQPHHVALMFSAKAGMSVEQYEKLLLTIPES